MVRPAVQPLQPGGQICAAMLLHPPAQPTSPPSRGSATAQAGLPIQQSPFELVEGGGLDTAVTAAQVMRLPLASMWRATRPVTG